jgi:predicted kinase
MEAVVFCGVQGAGKTTLYVERFLATHVRISRDLLRTRHREQVFLQACLETRQPFVVDKCNPTAAERAPYVAAARAAGFRVVAYWLDVAVAEAVARNERRDGAARIPLVGVYGTAKALEPPQSGEGFDEVVRISDASAGSR